MTERSSGWSVRVTHRTLVHMPLPRTKCRHRAIWEQIGNLFSKELESGPSKVCALELGVALAPTANLHMFVGQAGWRGAAPLI